MAGRLYKISLFRKEFSRKGLGEEREGSLNVRLLNEKYPDTSSTKGGPLERFFFKLFLIKYQKPRLNRLSLRLNPMAYCHHYLAVRD